MQVMLQVAYPQHGPYTRQELLFAGRLHQILIRARIQSPHLALGVGHPGQQNHGHEINAVSLFDDPASLEAVHHWHGDIHDNQVRQRGVNFLDRLFAVVGLAYLIALRNQDRFEEDKVLRFVIHNEDLTSMIGYGRESLCHEMDAWVRKPVCVVYPSRGAPLWATARNHDTDC